MENKENQAIKLMRKLAQDNEMWGSYLLPRTTGFNFDGSYTTEKTTSKRKLSPP